MSLGWLNLTDYLAANRETADELAQRLDAGQQQADEMAYEKVQSGLSLGEYEARARSRAALRQTDAGRAALLGGDAGDAFLAGRGQSNYQSSTNYEAMRRSQDARRMESEKYWAEQSKRNAANRQQRDDDTRKQREGFASAKQAFSDNRYGKGWDADSRRRYSEAVGASYDKAYRTPNQVRVISQEEQDAWTR